jgi:hypothetical protein
MEKLFRTIGKFWFPALTIIAGILLLANSGGKYAQNMAVILGSTGILLIGLVSLFFLLDVIKKPIRIAVSVVFALGAIYMINASYSSIADEIDFREKSKLISSQTKQGLKDIRTAQEAYYSVKGRYTDDLDSLVYFVKNGKIPTIKKIGAIPDSIGTETRAREMGMIVKMPSGMSEEQIIAEGLIVRDTVFVPVIDAKFKNTIAAKKRKFPFDPDKMKYAPYSKDPWFAKATVKNSGGVDQSVVVIKDPKPFTGDTLMIGSLDEAHLNGNWKED